MLGVRPGSREELQPRPPVSSWILFPDDLASHFLLAPLKRGKAQGSGCGKTAFLLFGDAVTDGDHCLSARGEHRLPQTQLLPHGPPTHSATVLLMQVGPTVS